MGHLMIKWWSTVEPPIADPGSFESPPSYSNLPQRAALNNDRLCEKDCHWHRVGELPIKIPQARQRMTLSSQKYNMKHPHALADTPEEPQEKIIDIEE